MASDYQLNNFNYPIEREGTKNYPQRKQNTIYDILVYVGKKCN